MSLSHALLNNIELPDGLIPLREQINRIDINEARDAIGAALEEKLNQKVKGIIEKFEKEEKQKLLGNHEE
jgi:hypothetical protein